MSRGISLVGLNRWQGGNTGDSTSVQCALDSRSDRCCRWTEAIGVDPSERLKRQAKFAPLGGDLEGYQVVSRRLPTGDLSGRLRSPLTVPGLK